MASEHLLGTQSETCDMRTNQMQHGPFPAQRSMQVPVYRTHTVRCDATLQSNRPDPPIYKSRHYRSPRQQATLTTPAVLKFASESNQLTYFPYFSSSELIQPSQQS